MDAVRTGTKQSPKDHLKREAYVAAGVPVVRVREAERERVRSGVTKVSKGRLTREAIVGLLTRRKYA